MDLRRASRWLVLLPGLVLLPAVARAGGWQHSAAFAVSGEHNSNVHLAADDEVDAWIGTVRPSYGLTWSDGRNALEIGGSLRIERSTDSGALDRNDPSAFAGWRRVNPRGSIGIRASYSKTSLRWLGIEPHDVSVDGPGLEPAPPVEQPVEQPAPVDDPRVIGRRGSRETSALNLAWSRALSPRTSMGLNTTIRTVQQNSSGLPDYAEQVFGASLSQTITPRLSVYTQGSWTRNDPDNGGAYQNISALVGISQRLSETLNASLDVGGGHQSPDGNGIAWQGGVSLAHRANRLNVSASVRRATASSAFGGFVETDTARFGVGYAVDERTQFGARFSCQKSRSADDSVLCATGASFSRRLLPNWAGTLSYDYRQRDGEHAPTARGHVVSLAVSYSWSTN